MNSLSQLQLFIPYTTVYKAISRLRLDAAMLSSTTKAKTETRDSNFISMFFAFKKPFIDDSTEMQKM